MTSSCLLIRDRVRIAVAIVVTAKMECQNAAAMWDARENGMADWEDDHYLSAVDGNAPNDPNCRFRGLDQFKLKIYRQLIVDLDIKSFNQQLNWFN